MSIDMTATNLWMGMWMCRRNGTALCGGMSEGEWFFGGVGGK